MKVRLKTLMAGPEGVFLPGSVIEVPPEEANALIAGGFAEQVEQSGRPEAVDPGSVETATVEPAVFFVLAPGVAAEFIPWLISDGWTTTKSLGWPLLGFGIILVAAGLLVLLDSFARFALRGLGTPAPVFPTQHLVVTGLYRHVRNPMYVGVVAVILGQSMLPISSQVRRHDQARNSAG
jgi:protein-S-isoprenylcysteine O-methyltransferase Ste14